MVLRNIMVITKTEAQMQGIIRGIESLDTEHQIGIIHGAYDVDVIDKITLTLAEVTGALIVKTPNVLMQDVMIHNNPILHIDVPVPEDDNVTHVINVITEEYGKDLINEILGNK